MRAWESLRRQLVNLPALDGPAGPDGPPGFGIDGEDGEDGSEGPPGPPGPAGATGAAGSTGTAGPPGFALDGEDGEDGFAGPPGSAGVAGLAGAAGPAGPQGLGLDGADGEDGVIYAIKAPDTVTSPAALTANALTFGSNGAEAITSLANVAAGQVLTSGTPPAWSAAPTVTGIFFGASSELNDYESGTWTPTDNSGGGLVFVSVSTSYVKIGSSYIAQISLNYPTTANNSNASIGGLPFAALVATVNLAITLNQLVRCNTVASGTAFNMVPTTGVPLTDANLSGALVRQTLVFQTS